MGTKQNEKGVTMRKWSKIDVDTATRGEMQVWGKAPKKAYRGICEPIFKGKSGSLGEWKWKDGSQCWVEGGPVYRVLVDATKSKVMIIISTCTCMCVAPHLM